ncbi:MAG TPA: EAL domain-containing protein [Bacillus bacterium]|nr:EAL domain-containing protein [Bacillus sp. (in: firmicutes)]
MNQGVEDIRVAVNISFKQFQQDNFVEIVKNTLAETDLDPQYLELEITESVAMNNPEEVIKKLQQLKESNIFISIDDFGMGYSSLNYLKRLPIDQLKVDRSFIQDIVETNDTAIVRAIISMAQSLQLSVVAEGVEQQLQATILKNLNCQIAQGFLYYKPMKESELINILTKKEKIKI